MCPLSVKLISYFLIILNNRIVVANIKYSSLFQSGLSYLFETLEWESNATNERVNILQEYDFIIVGAGSAGSVVANRLSEVKKWQVLLIEAGQESLHIMDMPLSTPMFQATSVNWKYRTVQMNNSCLGFEDQRCKFARGKVMGGSSVLNYMLYTRGNRKDYDRWEEMGNTGWSYNEVLKYFIKSEKAKLSQADMNYHGQDGLLSVTDVPYRTPLATTFVNAGSQIGLPVIDVNGKNQIGINYIQVTMKNGRRCSTNTAFLYPIKYRLNLHVKKNSMVTHILIDKTTNKANGVEFVSNGKTYKVFARKEIIISGGAINSPQLLILSGIGPKEQLNDKQIPLVKNLPVGENLMDHVAIGNLNVLINDTITLKLFRVLENPNNINDYTINHNGPLTVPAAAEALAFIDVDRPGHTDGHPNLELILMSSTFSSFKLFNKNDGVRTVINNKVYRPIGNTDAFVVLPLLLRPKSKGRVWLRDSNPFHHPFIDPNYFSDESDLDVLVAGVRLFQQMLKTDPMKSLDAKLLDTPLPGCAQHEFDSDDYWKCSARQMSYTVYHLSGTCKMGPEGDPTAVVDPRLRVHGIKNLRVIDASIIPEIPAAHTNAPAIMIGEKGADMIKEDWGIDF